MRPWVPLENMAAQADYVRAHRGAGDVVVVNYAGSYAFSYYWPDQPGFVKGVRPGSLIVFTPTYPADRRIVIAQRRGSTAFHAAISNALAMAHAPAHVWVLISHERLDDWLSSARLGVEVRRISLAGLGPRDALFELTLR
jgi:hypothetical protein